MKQSLQKTTQRHQTPRRAERGDRREAAAAILLPAGLAQTSPAANACPPTPAGITWCSRLLPAPWAPWATRFNLRTQVIGHSKGQLPELGGALRGPRANLPT